MLINEHKDFAGEKKQSLSGTISCILFFINIIILRYAFISNERSYRFLAITVPLLLASAVFHQQKKHIIRQRQLAGNGVAEVD